MTVSAVGLCVLGAAFSGTNTTAATVHATAVPCVPGVRSVDASVQTSRHVQTFVNRRLWVTRAEY